MTARRNGNARSAYRSPQDTNRRYITLGIIGMGVLIAILIMMYSTEQRNVASAPPQAASGSQTYDANIAALQQQLSQNPDDTDAMINLGNTYYDAQRYTDAIPWYEKALQKVPGNTDVRTDLGTAYYYSGNLDKAKEEWNLVLQQDPNKVQAHYNYAVLYSNLNPPDIDSAVKEWQTVIKIAPDSEQAKQAQQKLQQYGK